MAFYIPHINLQFHQKIVSAIIKADAIDNQEYWNENLKFRMLCLMAKDIHSQNSPDRTS